MSHCPPRRSVIIAVLALVLFAAAALPLRPLLAAVTCTPLGTSTGNPLGLCRPATGETNWAAAINGNADAINTAFSGAGNQLVGLNAAGTAVEAKTLLAGAGIALTQSVGGITVAATGTTLSSVNAYQVRNLVGQNDAVTPNTKYGYSADAVVLRNPTDSTTVIRTNTGTLTNDTGLAGSAANGRDQAGAFVASTWLHFYFIWNGTTLATLSSTVAPPTGPTLPTGYTHWAYAGAVFYNATPLLVRTRMRGAWEYYIDGRQTALSAGAATVETAVSLTTFIPPNALALKIGTQSTASSLTATLRIISGADFMLLGQPNQTTPFNYGQSVELPNVSQQFFYLWSGASGTLTIDVHALKLPNGGE
jgi:hypothetical protein